MKAEPYRITSPCAKCPFRMDIKPFLTAARAREIATNLERSEFPCHETLDYSDGEGRKTEKTAQPSQLMRICERIGMYDRRQLNMEAPVFESRTEWVAAQKKLGKK